MIKKKFKMSFKRKIGGRNKIKGVNSGEKGFNPKCWLNRGFKQESAKNIVYSTDSTFCLTILLRRIWTRKMNFDARVSKKSKDWLLNS